MLSVCNAIYSFDVLLTVHLSIFISVINQLDAQNLCFTISLFHVSTGFAQMRSSSGGQNCITRGCVMQFWPPDDEHMCSKHVEAWNKLTVKQILCINLVNYWDSYIQLSSPSMFPVPFIRTRSGVINRSRWHWFGDAYSDRHAARALHLTEQLRESLRIAFQRQSTRQ